MHYHVLNGFRSTMKLAEGLIVLAKTSVSLLNTHKSKIKNGAAVAALCGGWIALVDISCAPRDFVLWSGRCSLILGAATSKYGSMTISWAMHRIFTETQIQQTFGKSTNFAGNPFHVRHQASLLSVALAAPIILRSITVVAVMAFKSCASKPKEEKERSYVDREMRNLAILVIALTLLSRPVLHGGNQLAKRFIPT